MRINPFEKFLTRENREHAAIAQYLDLNNIRFIHCPAEGKKSAFERYLYSILGGKNKKGFPDFMIFEGKYQYLGLVIELKSQDKKGKWGIVSPEQKGWLVNLQKKGYFSVVCFGFDHAKKTIDQYFGLK